MKLNPVQSMASLKNFSGIFFIAALFFLAAFIYKLFAIDPVIKHHFNLPISEIDILPLFTTNYFSFISIGIFEIFRLVCIALLFFFLMKFTGSIDLSDPFQNLQSKTFLNKVVACSIGFFIVDAIGTLHLNYVLEEIQPDLKIRLFHFEYLFIVYFLNVFAVIFNRGVDLKNEIDLVI